MIGEKTSIRPLCTKPAGLAGYDGLLNLPYPPCKISESTIRNCTIDDLAQAFLLSSLTREDGTPPVSLIICTRKDASVAHYALEGLPNKVLAAEYRTVLPNADQIAAELAKARLALETRRMALREDQP